VYPVPIPVLLVRHMLAAQYATMPPLLHALFTGVWQSRGAHDPMRCAQKLALCDVQ
jgi:hypothetical protein